MANVRDLKKDINYVLGDIIEAVYIWELTNPGKDTKKSEAIIDEAIATFDELIVKVNNKKAENKKQHFKAINSELEEKGRKLIDKINALS
jgi:prolyl-tRNA synthetase